MNYGFFINNATGTYYEGSMSRHDDVVCQNRRPSAEYTTLDNGVTWVLKPAAPVTEVTMAQAEHALLAAGYLDAVNIDIPTLSMAAQIDWRRRPTIHRNHAGVLEIQAKRGWTDAQVDNLFALAATF